MPTQNLPSQQRISKNTGRVMLFIAVIFDLLPILLVFVVIFLVIMTVGGSAEDISNLSASVELYANSEKEWFFDRWFNKAGALIVGGISGAKLSAGIFAGGAVGIFLGPFIYMAGSFLASTLAYFVFTIWFYLKKVNIWTFGSAERVLVNFCTFVVENIPILDLLPGITFMVWRHIKVSRAEDTLKESEQVRKVSKLITSANKI